MAEDGGEEFRIKLVEERYGKEAAAAFADQTIALYTEAAIFRSVYKDSILWLREYVKKIIFHHSRGHAKHFGPLEDCETCMHCKVCQKSPQEGHLGHSYSPSGYAL